MRLLRLLAVPLVSAVVAALVVVLMDPGAQPVDVATDTLAQPTLDPELRSVAAARTSITTVVTLDGAVDATGDDPTFVAQVEPADLLRLPRRPESIRVKLTGGGSPVPCRFLFLGADDQDDPTAAPVRLRCELPDDVEIFHGLPGQAGVTLGSAENVVAVPVTAVVGTTGEAMVVVDEDGDHQERTVQLGLSDGRLVEIVDGLDEGELVVDPVPVDAWWQR